MTVRDTIDLGSGHLIEIGSATWDNTQTSVRTRYPGTNGDLASRSPGEIAIVDLAPLVTAVAERDLLDPATSTRLIAALAASAARQIQRSAPPSLSSLLERVTEENRHAEVETGPPMGNEAW